MWRLPNNNTHYVGILRHLNWSLSYTHQEFKPPHRWSTPVVPVLSELLGWRSLFAPWWIHHYLVISSIPCLMLHLPFLMIPWMKKGHFWGAGIALASARQARAGGAMGRGPRMFQGPVPWTKVTMDFINQMGTYLNILGLLFSKYVESLFNWKIMGR